MSANIILSAVTGVKRLTLDEVFVCFSVTVTDVASGDCFRSLCTEMRLDAFITEHYGNIQPRGLLLRL